MKIGVISDSHDEVCIAQRAVHVLESLRVRFAIHCGDVGLEVVPLLKNMRTHFVRGNMDDHNQLRNALTSPEHTYHDQLGTMELDGHRVAFLHGHDIKLLHHTIHSGDWDLVCHGHTHVFSSGHEGRTLVLNPGALSRTTSPSLATVELPSLDVAQIPL